MCGPADGGNDLITISRLVAAIKYATHDTFLSPDFARCQISFGGQAGKFCAGASPAGRPVVVTSWTEDKTSTVIGRVGRWTEQFNVIDVRVFGPGDFLIRQTIPDPPGWNHR